MKPKFTALLLLGCLAAASLLAGQQPPAQSSSAPAQQPSEAKKGKHQDVIFLFGTVFTEQGFTLRGAQVQVRRTGERKVRGEDVTNRVGEFSVHVSRGVEYEMTVKAKGFENQTLKIESNSGDRQDLVFRMKPVGGARK